MERARVRGSNLIKNCRAPVMERMMKIQPSMKMAAKASLYFTLPVPSARKMQFYKTPYGASALNSCWSQIKGRLASCKNTLLPEKHVAVLRPQDNIATIIGGLTVSDNVVGEVGIEPHSCADSQGHICQATHHKAGNACAGGSGSNQILSCLILVQVTC